MRFRGIHALVPALALVACQAVSGLSQLEKDPSFDPDAGDTGRSDTASTDTNAEPDTNVATDTGSPPVDTGVADTSKPPDTPACEGKVIGGNCFFVISDPKTWSQARDACIAAKAHLAIITTSEELTETATLGTGERWIGLYRDPGDAGAGDKSLFKWVNGEKYDPAKADGFATGEPDGNGACVRIRPTDNKWGDRTCETPGPFMCERD